MVGTEFVRGERDGEAGVEGTEESGEGEELHEEQHVGVGLREAVEEEWNEQQRTERLKAECMSAAIEHHASASE